MADRDEVWRIACEEVMTSQQAAEYLGITRGGVWRAAKTGALRQTPNGLYIKPDLDEYKKTAKAGRPKKEAE